MHSLSARVAALPRTALVAGGGAAAASAVALARRRAAGSAAAVVPLAAAARPAARELTVARSSGEGAASSTSTTLKVDGMVCSKCTARVEKALLGVPGVEAATADLATGAVAVSGPGATDAAALAAVVTGIGFPAVPAS